MESAPKNNFNSEPNEPNKPPVSKENSKKTIAWVPGQSPARRIEHASGVILPGSEKRLPFYQLGERRADDVPEKTERDSTSNTSRPEQSVMTHPAAEDLGSTATRNEREQLDALFRVYENEAAEDKIKTPDKNKDDASLPDAKKLPVTSREESPPAAKIPAERDAFQAFVENHKELADLSREALADTAASVTDAREMPAPDVGLAEFVKHPQEADVPADSAKDQESFQEFIQNHKELADLSAVENGAEDPLSDDDVFRELVMNEGAPDPGPNAWHEDERGTPPTADRGDMPPRSPFPPTAEGGAYDDSESGRFGEQYPSNPNLAQNPWVRAGDLSNPATLAGLSVLESRQQLDSLRHTTREAGLAGAVGILGLGLIFEHFGAKRRHKRNQRQIKAQGKELARTNKTLQEEQAAHTRTHEALQRLKRDHTTTSERLRDVQTHTLPKAETGAVGVVGVLAATEIAKRTAQKAAETQSRGKEFADPIHADTTTENLATLPQQEQESALRESVPSPELTEVVATAVNANTLRQEMRYERLQDKLADASTAPRTTVNSHQNGQNSTPAILPPVSGIGAMNQTVSSPTQERAQQKHAMHVASGWTWAIIGLILVAAAAAFFG